ncbi:MAG TPA: cyclic lactone autoinducer peptide [Clostridiales bacterium]|nr:cyclic lactone autoinducer peptide [Clostridiales bacterium]
MKKKVLMTVFAIGAALLTFLASASAASACWFFMYQPQEPKSLRKE